MSKVNSEIRLKLALEKALRADLQQYYNDLLSEMESQILNGAVYNITIPASYKSRLREILTTHQARIAGIFVDKTMIKVKNLETIYQQILNEVNQTLAPRYDKETEIINESTKTKTKEWMIAVLLLFREQDIQSTPENIAKGFNNIAKQRFQTKAISESITQTNWAVEKTKRINTKTITKNMVEQSKEAFDKRRAGDDAWKESFATVSALSAFSPREVAPAFAVDVYELIKDDSFSNAEIIITKFSQEKKTWETVGDNKVRETHLGAERMGAIGIDEYFQVGAYLMMEPGDSSMGAGLEEIINCRCRVVYI